MTLKITDLYVGLYVYVDNEKGEVTANDGQNVVIKFLNTYDAYNPEIKAIYSRF